MAEHPLPEGCTCYWSTALALMIPAKGCLVHVDAWLIPCAGCGRRWERDDMLEAYLPAVVATMDMPDGPVIIAPLTLCWVGGCCAALANPDQPGDPGFFDRYPGGSTP
jgi:hypothetical protein